MYAFFEFKIKVRLRQSAWRGYQWCVRSVLLNIWLGQRSAMMMAASFEAG